MASPIPTGFSCWMIEGIVELMSSSREEKPIVLSISSCSDNDGPICRCSNYDEHIWRGTFWNHSNLNFGNLVICVKDVRTFRKQTIRSIQWVCKTLICMILYKCDNKHHKDFIFNIKFENRRKNKSTKKIVCLKNSWFLEYSYQYFESIYPD